MTPFILCYAITVYLIYFQNSVYLSNDSLIVVKSNSDIFHLIVDKLLDFKMILC